MARLLLGYLCLSLLCGHALRVPFRTRRASSTVDGGVDISAQPPCKIRVVGVGGAGCNAIERMLRERAEIEEDVVEYWAVNTDAQALGKAVADETLQIGPELTRGLGAGGSPEQGRLAAEESRAEIDAMVEGADMVFITAGMGGGTGSGAAPVIARAARLRGALTIAVVTIPFRFEGGTRAVQAEMAQRLLVDAADSVVTVSNERLLRLVPDGTTADDAFLVADMVLRQAVTGTTDIVARPGLINVDFADVRSVMSGAGNCLVGIGSSSGPDRAEIAATAAVSCPLLDFRSFRRGKNRKLGRQASARKMLSGGSQRRRGRRGQQQEEETPPEVSAEAEAERIRNATEAATAAAVKEATEGDVSLIRGARGAVVNVVGGADLSMGEVRRAGDIVKQACHPEANIIFGAVVDPEREDGELAVTVLATGFDSKFLLSYRSRTWQVYRSMNRAFNSLSLYMEQRKKLRVLRKEEDEKLKEYLKGRKERRRSRRWFRRGGGDDEEGTVSIADIDEALEEGKARSTEEKEGGPDPASTEKAG